MNFRNNKRLLLFFPFVSFCILSLHVGLMNRIVNISYTNGFLYPDNFIINEGLFISFLSHIFMILSGFVLYGTVRDKDFYNINWVVCIYYIAFFSLIVFSIVYFFTSYNFYF